MKELKDKSVQDRGLIQGARKASRVSLIRESLRPLLLQSILMVVPSPSVSGPQMQGEKLSNGG